jgi:murein L,D-transpeptidase YafK
MKAFSQQRLLKIYSICLGFEPVGAKHFQGDGKTPEGVYHIDGKNPHSNYHKCLGVSYPSDKDRQYAKRAGKPTGGDIKIHGLPNGKGHLFASFIKMDWTAGCIAVTDGEIDELYTHTAVGVTVNILP